MRMDSRSLDEWRKYFASANSDIFELIERAIMVAVSDFPKEFKVRRDGIAEKLFSCTLTRCVGCDRVELAVVGGDKEENDEDRGCKSGFERKVVEFGVSKESKVNSCGDGDAEMDVNRVSNYSFGEAEALTDEIEEESQYVGEILRIREVLYNHKDEPESVLFDSLRRLQLLELTVDSLKATEIGKAVNPLRKHGSKDIRHLARSLIEGWKAMVDEWVKATTAIAGSEEGTPVSANPSVVEDDEEEGGGLPSPPMDEGPFSGLPSPPMDVGAFFVTQTGSMELSQFFDGMDEDGNPRPSGKFIKNHENEAAITAREVNRQPTKKNEAAIRPNKPITADSGPGRPPKTNMVRKSNVEPKVQNDSIIRRPPIGQLDKSMRSDDAAVQVKLEATKRKLHESYQQVENAKRQRTIQVMEIVDLPKPVIRRNPHFKPGYHNRNWANGRR